MEILFNITQLLLRIEILLFFVSLGYGLFYIGDILMGIYKNSQTQKKQRIEKRKKILSQQSNTSKKPSIDTNRAKNTFKKEVIDIDRLRDTIKRVQVNKARWYYETARSLIVEWLTIDKNNKELNLELGEVYELEENFKNAEYIYKDMLETTPDNVDLLKRLWNVLALQGNIEQSVKSYSTAFDKKRDDIEVVDILSNLYFDLKNFKKCLKFAKLFLKNKPRDIEKLGMKWYCLEKQWNSWESVECYKRILELQPYNMEIKERIAKLES